MNYSQNLAISLLYKEFVYRLGYLFFCFFASCISSWVYGKELLYIYIYPLSKLSEHIVFTSISEAFTTTLNFCIYLGFFSSFPFFLYLSLCFFLPSLFLEEKTFFYKIVSYVLLSYTFCIVACSFYIIPELCSWFLKYGTSTDYLSLSFIAKISSYVSWSQKVYMFCFCILQIPVCFWVFLNSRKTLNAFFFLSQNRKYVSICILLFCAAISPPDLYSQSILFLLCFGLFEYILWHKFLKQNLYLYRQKKL